MKKFIVNGIEANANEYNIFPKTGHFTASIDGVKTLGATTSGRGKSAVANHYIYFKEPSAGGSWKIFYVKSTAEGIIAASKSLVVTTPGAAPAPTEPPTETPQESAEPVAEQPKRRRVAKTEQA